MTDNEKAATFIGWKDKPCTTTCINSWAHATQKPHNRRCPDMSDPRNYMKALEGLRQRNVIWVIYANATGDHGIEIRLKPSMPDYPNAHRCLVDFRGGADFALAVVKALAALYDAEHKG